MRATSVDCFALLHRQSPSVYCFALLHRQSLAVKISLPWPEDGHIQDYVYHSRDGKWVRWDTLLPNADIPVGIAYRYTTVR